MKNNKMEMFKIISGLVLILAVPILFFQLMGVSLLKPGDSNKRVIAIVNEDQAQFKEEENIEMGREVVSILTEDSPYEWKVMGRGAAVNGLKSNQYEAVVYIPSDFSESIMSYDQQNPQKAAFSYQVQRQKTGTRKEKVLHEIDTATNRVNNKISTLYWSYVAQEMNHIKKEFTNILGKETEFLDAMSDYYKSGSEALAVDMKSQKEQMEGLFAMVDDTDNEHNTRIESTESFGLQMDDFITYVQQYKEFQEVQKSILQQVQADSLAKIHSAAATQTTQFNESIQTLEENNEKLNNEITKVNEKISENEQKFNALSDLRKDEVNRQLKDLLAVQGTAIDRYNETILNSLERGIAAGKEIGSDKETNLPGNQQEIQAIKEEMERKAAAKSETILPGLQEEQLKVSTILSALQAMKEKVAETEPESTFINELEQLKTELSSITLLMTEKESQWQGAQKKGTDDYIKATADYGKLFNHYRSVRKEAESVRQILNSNPADTARMLVEIRKKEESLLKHTALSANRKERLEKLFAKGQSKTDTDALLSYYATLDQFGVTLNERGEGVHKDELLKDEILTSLLKNVVSLNESELQGWEMVGEGMPEAQLGMSNLTTTFAAIMSGYEETVEEQHSALLANLNSIDEQANVLLTQIQTPETMITSGEPVQSTGEGEVVAGQHNVSSQLIALSGLLNSVSEQQGNLVDYASDLHVKANDMNKTSNKFSSKWETNLDEMSVFKDDIQGFLANTYIDGQENGYVFDHFVNPLQVKGEATVVDETKKVPPVILFIVLLISSLLIGFFSHQLKQGSIGLRLAMTGLLSLIVGLIVSLYSINMYILNDQRAMEWTFFTILLLLAGAAIIHAALEFGQWAGWIASLALMCLYISPLLILGVPEINIPDILSTVYMSIKYEPETRFIKGAISTALIAIAMLTVSFLVNKYKTKETRSAAEAYEE